MPTYVLKLTLFILCISCTENILAIDSGFVFERTDKDEQRYVVGTDNIWISSDCAAQLGGATQSGTWADLNAIAPNFDAINNPCNDLPTSQGYVFSRTDTNEYRYVQGTNNIWIDSNCAAQLGGATQFGTWAELNAVAPNFDSIQSPCSEVTNFLSEGYIFARTDIDEFRYVLGTENVWISIDCAIYLLVSEEDFNALQFGTWAELNAVAPNFDAIESPCDEATLLQHNQEFVFSRTDVDEYRYVVGANNIWIDSDCAAQLGGATRFGTWADLNALAPNFDSIISPCPDEIFDGYYFDDINGDGIVDVLDGDFNADGSIDSSDFDFNGDGFVDMLDDINGDGFTDFLDFDINGDGFVDYLDDTNLDGTINSADVMTIN